ncbi:MAG: YihY/virulence factor BrkB family protein [Gammaproteobacteria bacterium]|nr:YihY/virulence factor BrkB family protein [Gammaproteobacteria bacterium]
MIRRIANVLEGWLFAPAATGNPLSWPRRVLRYPYALLRDLLGGQLNLHAMSLVFQTLLALVPLLAFSFAILQVFGAHRELQPLIHEFFRPMGTEADALTQRVMQFADKVHGSLVGSVGLALLIWTLLGTLKKVEDSLNYVWHVEQPRNFARRIAEYLGMLVVGPLLVVAVIGMTQLALTGRSAELLAHLPLASQLLRLALSLLPYAIITALFAFIYAFIPNTRVRLHAALIGGLAAGILWALTGRMFAMLVVTTARLTIVYAGFAIIVATFLWTYLSWLILLLGAQLSFYVQNPSYLRLGLHELRMSGEESERLALALMYLVAEAHENGTTRPDVNTLALRLGLPGIAVARTCAALESAGLIVTTEDGQLLPGRGLAAIRIGTVMDVARRHVHGLPHAAQAAPAPVEALCRDIDRAWRAACAERTLQQMLDEGADRSR